MPNRGRTELRLAFLEHRRFESVTLQQLVQFSDNMAALIKSGAKVDAPLKKRAGEIFAAAHDIDDGPGQGFRSRDIDECCK